jgi:hypothetical protein
MPTFGKNFAGARLAALSGGPSGQIQDTLKNTISGVWARNNHYL